MNPSKTLLLAAALGSLLSVSAMGQIDLPVSRRGGGTTPAPAPAPAPVSQPTPVYTPPPAPVVTVPPPAPAAPVNPLLVGTSSGFGMGSGLSATLQQLNTVIANFNQNGANLPQATLEGAVQQNIAVSAATVTPVAAPAPVSDPSVVVPVSRRGGAATPAPAAPAPVAPTTPQAITQIDLDVTGLKFVVLKWGDINHHFYVGDSSGVQTFRGTAPLSSYSTYFASVQQVSVPDSGQSVLLLATALAGLGMVYRRRRM